MQQHNDKMVMISFFMVELILIFANLRNPSSIYKAKMQKFI